MPDEVEQTLLRLRERRAALELKLKGELSEWTRNYTLTVELPQVEVATRRVHEGAYGDCVDCGEAIEPRRLAAIPEVLVCKPCEDSAPRSPNDRERRV